MHSYQHNIKTFNNATRHLTRVERSLYRDLIELYYDTEQPLPAVDFDRLARRVLAISDEEKTALQFVLDEFFTLTGDCYTHDYCDEQIEKFHAATTAKAKAGKASAEARKKKAEARKEARKQQKQTSDEQVLSGSPTGEQRNPTNQKPETNNQKPDINTNGSSGKPDKPSLIDQQFESIWQAYPKREGSNPKTKAKSAFKARIKDGADPALIAQGVSRYRKFCEAKGSIGTEYVMQAQRFFGPGKEYENDWLITEASNGKYQPGGNKPLSKSEQSESAFRDYIAGLDCGEAEEAGSIMGDFTQP